MLLQLTPGMMLCATRSATICKFDESNHHYHRRRNKALLKPLQQQAPVVEVVLQ
jgi:hypothetical protein